MACYGIAAGTSVFPTSFPASIRRAYTLQSALFSTLTPTLALSPAVTNFPSQRPANIHRIWCKCTFLIDGYISIFPKWFIALTDEFLFWWWTPSCFRTPWQGHMKVGNWLLLRVRRAVPRFISGDEYRKMLKTWASAASPAVEPPEVMKNCGLQNMINTYMNRQINNQTIKRAKIDE